MNEKSRIQVRDGAGELPWEDVGHDSTHQKVPVTIYDENGDAVSLSNCAIRVDYDTTPDTTYLGIAPIASAEDEAVWQILSIDEASGYSVTWADGNDSFDNVWDDRATTVVYS